MSAHRVYVICPSGENYFDLDGSLKTHDELCAEFGKSFGYDLARTELYLTFDNPEERDTPIVDSSVLHTDDRLRMSTRILMRGMDPSA